jgi:cytochrome b561
MPSPMPARYTSTAIALHWLIALLLLGQFAFGLFLEDIPRGTPARGYYVNLHKSTGILIGLLILAAHRLAPDTYAAAAASRHAGLAKAGGQTQPCRALPVHAGTAPVRLPGLEFQQTRRQVLQYRALAGLGAGRQGVYSLLNQTHKLAALVLAIFVGLHLLAVPKHMLIDRDGLLLRMWPARARPVPPRSAPSPETR